MNGQPHFIPDFEHFVKLIAILVFDHMTTDHHRKLHDHALQHY